MKAEDKTKVYHLLIKSTGIERYFASLGAIYSNYDRDSLGIAYQSLKNHFFKGNDSYENVFCVIKRGILERNKKGE